MEHTNDKVTMKYGQGNASYWCELQEVYVALNLEVIDRIT